MRDEFLIEQAREAIKRRAAVPVEQRWADLVNAGIIDEKGNVLIRMPEPPKEPKPARKKKKKKGPTNSRRTSNGDAG